MYKLNNISFVVIIIDKNYILIMINKKLFKENINTSVNANNKKFILLTTI